jgi:hypothetical protein
VTRRLATLHELQTIYSLEDLYDLMEIASVEAYNRRLIDKVSKESKDADSNR